MGEPAAARLVGMRDYLRKWRQERNITDVPDHLRQHLGPNPIAKGRRRKGLTQFEVATMAGVRERWYWELETHGRGSEELVETVAMILGLNKAQEMALYRWAQIPPPARLPGPRIQQRMVIDLTRQADSAFYIDGSWDVLAYNETAALHFPWITAPRANILESILGPDQIAREMIVGWPSWASPLVEILRAQTSDKKCPRRLKEIANAVLENPATLEMWESGTAMLDHIDGCVWSVKMPTMWGRELSGMITVQSFIPERRSDLRMIILSPIQPAESLSLGRGDWHAQELADAARVFFEGAYSTVNYPAAPRGDVSEKHIDIQLRRAAISTKDDRPLPFGFLKPGDIFPPLPEDSREIARHRRGEHVLLQGYDTICAALENEKHLIKALVPPDAHSLMHSPLVAPDERILGSIEVWQTEGGPPFGPEHLAVLRHMADLRAKAMAEEESQDP